MNPHQIFFTGMREPRPGIELPDGVELLHLPTVEIAFSVPGIRHADELIERLATSPVFVSGAPAADGLENWFRRAAADVAIDLDLWSVGESVGEALARNFGTSGSSPRETSGAGICAELAARSGSVVLVVGEAGRPDLVEGLAARGVDVEEMRVYRTALRDCAELRARFRNDRTQTVIFPGARTVDGFLLTIRRDDFHDVETRIACLGDDSSGTVVNLGGVVAFDGGDRALEDLLRDIVRGPAERS